MTNIADNLVGYLTAMAEGIRDDSVYHDLTRYDRRVWSERMEQAAARLRERASPADEEKLRSALQRIANLPLRQSDHSKVDPALRARRIAVGALGGDHQSIKHMPSDDDEPLFVAPHGAASSSEIAEARGAVIDRAQAFIDASPIDNRDRPYLSDICGIEFDALCEALANLYRVSKLAELEGKAP